MSIRTRTSFFLLAAMLALQTSATGPFGVNAAAFHECLDSGKHGTWWQQNVALGQRLGVSGTPTFFVHGRMVTGDAPYQVIRSLIDEELARVSASPSRAMAATGAKGVVR